MIDCAVDINQEHKENQKKQFKIYKIEDGENFKMSFSKGDIEIMKNLRYRTDHRWEARKVINGQKICVIKSKKTECIEEFKRQIKAIKNSEKTIQNNQTLSEYGIEWAKIYKKQFVSDKSFYEINRVFINTKNKAIDMPLKKLTTLNLQVYLNSLKNNRTKELIITYYNACLKRAVKDNILIKNPMEDIEKAPKIKKVRKPFTYLQQQQILEIIKNTDIQNFILIYLFTGIRKNELDTKNIKNNIHNDLLIIKSEKKRNSEEYREIDLTEKTKKLILNTNFNLTPLQISKKFRKLLDDIDLPKGYGLHTLRHTFTTNHFYLRTPDKYVQSWLGHEEIETTKKHYTAIDRTLTKEKLLNLYSDYYYIVK